MPAAPPVPAELWDTVPPAARAAFQAVPDELRRRLADSEARLAQTSCNSHRPPSAGPPHAEPAPPKAPSGKRPGGQPGHAHA